MKFWKWGNKKADKESINNNVTVNYPFWKKMRIFVIAFMLGALVVGYKWYGEYSDSVKKAFKYNHVIKQIPDSVLMKAMVVEASEEDIKNLVSK